jgi:uncharacterized protein YjbI with pentapeptide repeats
MDLKGGAEKLVVDDVDLGGSTFNQVGLRNVTMKSASFDGSKLDNINMADCNFNNIELTGAVFRYVKLPKAANSPNPVPNSDTVTFKNCNLRGAKMSQCNMSNVEISDCDISGMTINGIPVEHLLTLAEKQKGLATVGEK